MLAGAHKLATLIEGVGPKLEQQLAAEKLALEDFKSALQGSVGTAVQGIETKTAAAVERLAGQKAARRRSATPPISRSPTRP